MIHTLELTNFRKCRNEVLNFSEGLNAIRGANEAGKSTRLEALAYLMFGSAALREPLDDVVTWGEKVSSLKVAGTLSINGAVFNAKRGKSGAEISSEGKVLCTGQTECTKFFSGLIGADPKVAANLMLSDQGSLRGALKEGPTATAALIEKLSNFSLIDEIISLVQEKLPVGSPKVLQSRVATLSEQVLAEAPGELDQAAQVVALDGKAKDLLKEQVELVAVTEELAPAAAAAAAGRQQAAILASQKAALSQARAAIERARAALADLKPVSTVTADHLTALRAAVAAEQQRAQALTAQRAVTAVARPDPEWDADRASFDAEVAVTAQHVQHAQAALHTKQMERQALVAKLITEQACAFCGKDLSDVPEVVQHNVLLNTQVQQADASITRLTADLADLQDTRTALQAIAKADQVLSQALRTAGAFYKLHDESVPPRLEWIGPDLTAPVDIMATQKLQAAEAELRRADRDAGQKQALEAELERAQAAGAAAKIEVDRLEPLVAKDRSSGLSRTPVQPCKPSPRQTRC